MRITAGTVLDTPNDGRWTVEAILDVWDLSSLVLLVPDPPLLVPRRLPERPVHTVRTLTQRELLYGILSNYFSRVST